LIEEAQRRIEDSRYVLWEFRLDLPPARSPGAESDPHVDFHGPRLH
jgi:hypothetical protein